MHYIHTLYTDTTYLHLLLQGTEMLLQLKIRFLFHGQFPCQLGFL